MKWLSSSALKIRTSFHLCLLHVLPRHGVASDDLLQCRSREILLAGLFLGVVLSRVLLKALEAVGLPPIFVLRLFEKFARLFAHFQHPCRGKTQHFNNPAYLIVFRGAGEQGQAQEELNDNASE